MGNTCRVYLNVDTKLRWKCAKDHEWDAPPYSIKAGFLCPYCAGNARLTIEQMQKLAKTRGGKCLSKKYINSVTKLTWQCAEEHKWKAVPASVVSGRWCAICIGSRNEQFCRSQFEAIFGDKFPKVRPDWLISDKGWLMELDGYCERLNVAFEYQGEQHYKEIKNFFHKDSSLQEQKKRDKLKKRLCKKNDVILIEIPYTVPRENLKAYILKQREKFTGLDIYFQTKVQKKWASSG